MFPKIKKVFSPIFLMAGASLLAQTPGIIGSKVQDAYAIEGLLAVTILKLVLDYMTSQQTGTKIEKLGEKINQLNITIIKSKNERAK